MHVSVRTRGGYVIVAVLSSVLAKAVILVDEFSSAFMSVAVASDTFGNGCGDTVRMNVTFTPCGEQVMSFFKYILFECPVGIVPFWMPMLGDALRGLTVAV
jgi:hypothetical protein